MWWRLFLVIGCHYEKENSFFLSSWQELFHFFFNLIGSLQGNFFLAMLCRFAEGISDRGKSRHLTKTNRILLKGLPWFLSGLLEFSWKVFWFFDVSFF
jgi:hypothetical protein